MFVKEALSPLYEITIKLVPYETGIFILTNSGQYNFDKFKAAVEDEENPVQRSDAKLIKIATEALCDHDSAFAIEIDAVTQLKYTSGVWGPSGVVGTIAYNGYYNTALCISTGNSYIAAALANANHYTLGSSNLDGFLPSREQIQIASSQRNLIDEMISYTRPDNTVLFNTWLNGNGTHTSSESGESAVFNYINTGIRSIPKSTSQRVIPFYTI